MLAFVAQWAERRVPPVAARGFVARIWAQPHQWNFFWRRHFRDGYDAGQILVYPGVKPFQAKLCLHTCWPFTIPIPCACLMSERPEGEQCDAAAVVGCGPLVHGGDAWWQVLGTEVLVARALPQQVAHGWAHFHGGTAHRGALFLATAAIGSPRCAALVGPPFGGYIFCQCGPARALCIRT